MQSFPSRTELLGCYSDQDFLAKLHCVRQAFQVSTAPPACMGAGLCPSRATKSSRSSPGFAVVLP